MREMAPAVYIMASGERGYMYVGVTSNLAQRVWQHREGTFGGYSAWRHTTHLVWFEMHGVMEAAITHEKKLKGWNRDWKINLIEAKNPDWRDLYHEIR